jgi:hypothetical protein
MKKKYDFPGKRCVGKKVADMTVKELREHRKWTTACCRHRRDNFSSEQKAAELKRARLYQSTPKAKAIQIAWHRKERQQNPEFYRKYAQDGIDSLSKSYVKGILNKQLGLKYAEIPDEIVELKRAQIKLRRMANA